MLFYYWKSINNQKNNFKIQRKNEIPFLEKDRNKFFYFIPMFLGFLLEKQGKPPKIEEGLSLTYLIDKNQYIHFGNHKSLKSDSGSEVSFQKSTYFFFKKMKIRLFLIFIY